MFNRVFYLYLPKADKWKQKANGRTEDFTFRGKFLPNDTMLQAELAGFQLRNGPTKGLQKLKTEGGIQSH